MTETPSVDVIIPAADASASIGDAIDAVRAQRYPNLGSIVVATSDEATRRVAGDHGAIVIPNPTGTTPAGLNLALAATRADYIARVDAHSTIPVGYLRLAVEVLIDTGADNVGGMQVPVGRTIQERAIAAAMSSPIGAGNARYRVGGAAGPTDTVYLGVFRRSTLERLGGYDERFERNQDYELNHRIRESGGLIWFDPRIRVLYRPRGSFLALARQYFDYGRWKREFSRRHPGNLRWRQVAAPLLVVLLTASVVIGLFWRPAWLAFGGYALVLIGAGLRESPRIGVAALVVPAALATMHLSWGLGFLFGRRGPSRKP